MKKTLYEVLAVVLAIVLIAGGSYLFGHHNEATAAKVATVTQELKQQKADNAELQRQQVQTQANAKAADEVGAKRDEAQAKNETHFQTITKTVYRYVQTHPDSQSCTLDDDGLRIWRAANSGDQSADTDQSRSIDAAQVRDGAAAASGRQAVDATAEPRTDGARVSPLRDRSQRAD